MMVRPFGGALMLHRVIRVVLNPIPHRSKSRGCGLSPMGN